MAGVEPVEEAFAREEVGLGALLGSDVDLAPAVLLELVLGERGLRQDLGEEREARVEIPLEDERRATDESLPAETSSDRGEVVDRLGERARVAPARPAEERVAGDLGRALAARRVGRAPAPGKSTAAATVGRRPQRAARTARPLGRTRAGRRGGAGKGAAGGEGGGRRGALTRPPRAARRRRSGVAATSRAAASRTCRRVEREDRLDVAREEARVAVVEAVLGEEERDRPASSASRARPAGGPAARAPSRAASGRRRRSARGRRGSPPRGAPGDAGAGERRSGRATGRGARRATPRGTARAIRPSRAAARAVRSRRRRGCAPRSRARRGRGAAARPP